MTQWWPLFATTFVAVFVAELGDKTQLAAFGLSARAAHPWAVFLGASAALVLASALAVGAGRLLAQWVDPRWLHYGGALLFVAIGVWMLWSGPERPEEAAPAPAREAPGDPAGPAPPAEEGREIEPPGPPR